jgi:predicted amidohydrolase YtcJ
MGELERGVPNSCESPQSTKSVALLTLLKDILDADPVLRGRPIVLFRTDLHAMWLSGRALELCGALPAKVEGGEIIRSDNGKPTGIFLDLAQSLVPRPPWSERQMRSYFKTAVQDVLRVGITAVHDAMTREPVIEFYKQ